MVSFSRGHPMRAAQGRKAVIQAGAPGAKVQPARASLLGL
ncbi:hypothetical protein AIOL_003691 [Candidatus Rhodobacter oscarellae]|uniref:Uncharacterized protein n=1 Tax=Candidatus Rhodobacter oscarellae TaxID=1675527 RepID=A0A0J9E7M5_9RHOB|nr:hypothetical protein AIOL_003691 [Candidatus Rhodobacter lobularis]